MAPSKHGARRGTWKSKVGTRLVSFNIYHDTITPEEWDFTTSLGKPVIIGEFHFGATDRGLFHAGARPRKNQTERALAYEKYIQSAVEMPAFVGAHWFHVAWVSNPSRVTQDNRIACLGWKPKPQIH